MRYGLMPKVSRPSVQIISLDILEYECRIIVRFGFSPITQGFVRWLANHNSIRSPPQSNMLWKMKWGHARLSVLWSMPLVSSGQEKRSWQTSIKSRFSHVASFGGNTG